MLNEHKAHHIAAQFNHKSYYHLIIKMQNVAFNPANQMHCVGLWRAGRAFQCASDGEPRMQPHNSRVYARRMLYVYMFFECQLMFRD